MRLCRTFARADWAKFTRFWRWFARFVLCSSVLLVAPQFAWQHSLAFDPSREFDANKPRRWVR